jgi:hypothetical protein
MNYLAEYHLQGGRYSSALLHCRHGAEEHARVLAWLTETLGDVLHEQGVNPSVRLTFERGAITALLWLGGCERSLTDACAQRAARAAQRHGLSVSTADSAKEFDARTQVTGVVECVDTGSFQVGGLPIIPTFNLAESCAPLLLRARSQSALSYQINLRNYQITPDDERMLRRWQLRLAEAREIPWKVLQAQERTQITHGDKRVLVDEWLLAANEADLVPIHRVADEDFASDNRDLGVQDSPLLRCASADAACAGLHRSLLQTSPGLAALAASCAPPAAMQHLLAFAGVDGKPPKPAETKADGQGARAVFISYAFRDYITAARICSELESAGMTCWMAPRDIPPGAIYAESIMRGIESARVLVLVFSGRSNHSKYVLREIERAVAHGLVVIPFRIENENMSQSLQFFLSACQWIEGHNEAPAFERSIQQLTATVRSLMRA